MSEVYILSLLGLWLDSSPANGSTYQSGTNPPHLPLGLGVFLHLPLLFSPRQYLVGSTRCKQKPIVFSKILRGFRGTGYIVISLLLMDLLMEANRVERSSFMLSFLTCTNWPMQPKSGLCPPGNGPTDVNKYALLLSFSTLPTDREEWNNKM